MKSKLTRRRFISATTAGVVAVTGKNTAIAKFSVDDKPAILGGPKTRATPVTAWPILGDVEEKELLKVLHSKRWNRLGGSVVDHFEKTWAERLSAKHCVATSSGTSEIGRAHV